MISTASIERGEFFDACDGIDQHDMQRVKELLTHIDGFPRNELFWASSGFRCNDH